MRQIIEPKTIESRRNGMVTCNCTLIQTCANWSDFLHAQDTPRTGTMTESTSTRKSESWDLNAGYAGMLTIAREGWTEKVSEAERMAEPLLSKLTSRIERTEYVYDVTGDTLDIGRYLSGCPDVFSTPSYTYVDGTGTRIISIVVNISASAGIGADELFSRGVAVVALVNLLELAGYRCEVTVAAAMTGAPNYGYLFTVPVKRADDTVSLPFLMAALAHPGTLRRLWFRVAESFPGVFEQNITQHAYGTPAEMPMEERGDIYLNSALLGGKYPVRWWDTDSVLQWLISQLTEFGVQLKG